uniref:Uncharacterized protein n=1 Tax=Salix viminalis TaxID=40686 RepID=A0A6N2M687_SALVM
MHHLVSDQQNLHQLHQQSRLVFQELALSHFMPSTKSLLVTLLMFEPKMFSWLIKIQRRQYLYSGAAINAGDRVDSALKDMAIVMKQQNRADEAIEAIKSLRHRCSDQAQESLDNILLDLYKMWKIG